MKRLIIIAIALLGSILAAKAQDVIKTRSGEDILAKVSEVTPYSIKYKRFSNLDGPTYTMDIVNVIMIQYENGEKDVFDRALAQGLNSPDPVPEGLRYRDYRKLYNSKRYIRQFDDKYSPGWSGVASFVIPGLGQAIDGEWGRAAGFFLGSVLLSSIARAGVSAPQLQCSAWQALHLIFGVSAMQFTWQRSRICITRTFGRSVMGLAWTCGLSRSWPAPRLQRAAASPLRPGCRSKSLFLINRDIQLLV